jgi:uncharacterized protein YuzE
LVDRREGNRHAVVERLEFVELIRALVDALRDTQKRAAPVAWIPRRPGALVEGAPRGVNGGVDVRGGAGGDRRRDRVRLLRQDEATGRCRGSLKVKITYDPNVDVLYIRFKDTRVSTRHVSDDIALDYDAHSRLAGIEIVDASALIADPAALQGATFERL